MARPVVTTAAEELYAALEAFAALDEAQDWHLLKLCEVIATGTVIDQLHGYVTEGDEDDETHGWGIVVDPVNAPDEALGWLAQFVGVDVTPGMTEAETRQAILLPIGFQRGTPAALEQAVKETLTGSETVLVDERYTGNAWALRVRTLESETPSDAVTQAAILAHKPIGIVLTFDSITVWDWGDLQAAHADWTAVQVAYDDWLEARTQLP